MHPGMVIMHPRMVTIASRNGDLEMAIDASRDGDRCIPGWRSMHPGMAIGASGMAIDASRDGDRCMPGWRSMHPGMVIIASLD